jgi:hypothetical protein
MQQDYSTEKLFLRLQSFVISRIKSLVIYSEGQAFDSSFCLFTNGHVPLNIMCSNFKSVCQKLDARLSSLKRYT